MKYTRNLYAGVSTLNRLHHGVSDSTFDICIIFSSYSVRIKKNLHTDQWSNCDWNVHKITAYKIRLKKIMNKKLKRMMNVNNNKKKTPHVSTNWYPNKSEIMCIAHSSVHNMDQNKHNKKIIIHVESERKRESDEDK